MRGSISFKIKRVALAALFYLSANHRATLTGVGAITKGLHSL